MRSTLLSSTLLLAAACEPQVCTLMYVPDGVNVAVEDAALAPGVWRFEAEGGACEVTLPDDGTTLACDQGVQLELSADGATVAAFSLWDQAPDDFELVVSHDGVEVLREVVVPTYTESEPNGEGCGVTRHGEASVRIDAA